MEALERREMLSADTAIFDETYYLSHNPDVASAVSRGLFSSGLEHFLKYGMFEDRSPSPFWDENFYLATNVDISYGLADHLITSAVQHFIMYGDAEGRTPSPLFSPAFYLQSYPDVAAAVSSGQFKSAFDHFIQYGDKENRAPNPTLDTTWYLATYPDVARAVQLGTIASATDHYLLYGQFEGRDPSVLFDQSFYLANNPDVQAALDNHTILSAYDQWRTEALHLGYARPASTNAYVIEKVIAANETPVAISSGSVVVGTTDGVASSTGPNVGGNSDLAGISATAVSYYGVVGQSINAATTGVADGRAVLRQNDGTIVDLGNLSDGSASPVNNTVPMAITDNLYVVGSSMVWVASESAHHSHPFLWEQWSGIVDLGLPAAPAGYNGSTPYYSDGVANSVNIGKVIVGQVTVDSSILPTTTYAFLWRQDTGYTVFAGYSAFLQVSDAGVILARSQSGEFVLLDYTGAVVGSVPAQSGSVPNVAETGLNNYNIAVGYAASTGAPALHMATVTINSRTFLLNDIFYNINGTSTYQFVDSASINDKGEIAVKALIDGQTFAVTLIPAITTW